jgi:hypothetical protein
MKSEPGKPCRWEWQSLWLILGVAAAVSYYYLFAVGLPMLKERITLHDLILSGCALSPYRYRVLIPWIAQGMISLNALVLPFPKAFVLVYTFLDSLGIFLALAALYYYLREWFKKEISLIGTLVVAATMAIALRDHELSPWSWYEAAMVSWGFWLLHREKYRWFTLLMVLATLNRETAVFLPLAYLFTNQGILDILRRKTSFSWKPFLPLIGWWAIWGVIYAGLRLGLGWAPHVMGFGQLLMLNLMPGTLIRSLVKFGLLFGLFWFWMVPGFKKAPGFVWGTAGMGLCYLLAILVMGSWKEARLLMPLYPVIIPLGLSYLFPEEKE